ncbi:MAG TPA: GTP pyrophosphokinase [Candidatus Caccovicinus merdipullorum]|uniref:GTP pyrophosphokinase n=1 Tax=Candidatus Caccovicinus merdipullorum TaxID=2840724 RepID=A0A9D1GJW4_9FIRM|nr:GTP pyrophosphokinase [Candidatus Caccovicinus merdipullorum]
MKTQDLKKFKSSSFLVKSNSAISMLLAKLEIANAELSMKLGRNVLINMCGRVKTIESIQAKCRKKGYDATYECAMEKINDIIGVRGVCSFEDDVYRVAEVLSTHQDLKIIKRKDYIQQPKNSGYRSLHLIVEIPIYFQGEMQWIRAEIQLRTTAMDFWAGVDHQLRYKKGKKEAVLIGKELKEYSQAVAELDRKMVELRKRIDAI